MQQCTIKMRKGPAKLDMNEADHQKYIQLLRLCTTDPDKSLQRQYTCCHRTDGMQHGKIHDALTPHTGMSPSTLDISSDADHAPADTAVLAKTPLTCNLF
jgi:hypothetical protein